MEYEFNLKFALPATHESVDELVDRLGAAGCEDALVGIGQAGRIALEFTRDAESAKSAVFSALAAVKAAISGAKFLAMTSIAGPDMAAGASPVHDVSDQLR